MVHKTRGIVLRCVKYGETSIICTVFTELLGLQSYMVKGVRSHKPGNKRGNLLFPSSILDMVVQRQPQKNLNFIKEYQPYHIYQSLQEEVIKNGVAMFCVEVATQLLEGDDPQPELFSFFEHFLIMLDRAQFNEIANLPLFFLIQSAKISGYYISGSYGEHTPFVDVHEGRFSGSLAHFPPFIEGREAQLVSSVNAAESPEAISKITMSHLERKHILQYYLIFLQLHIPHFRELKSLPVLVAILS